MFADARLLAGNQALANANWLYKLIIIFADARMLAGNQALANANGFTN